MFVEAFNAMAKSVDKGMETKDIEVLYVGNFSSDLFEGQGPIAPIIAVGTPLTVNFLEPEEGKQCFLASKAQ